MRQLIGAPIQFPIGQLVLAEAERNPGSIRLGSNRE